MHKGRIRRMFAGGNTSRGFFSYFDNIIDQEEAERIFILKGGPGTGKSAFIKKIGTEMADRGYDIEFIHCSNDSDSLDGVLIPELKIALVDGTAPHVVEPKNPGAVDVIINLGDFWDDECIRRSRKEILMDGIEKQELYKRAYRYIKAASCFHEDSAAIYSRAVDRAKVNMEGERLTEEIFGFTGAAEKEGRQRRLFASAITSGGLKNYLDTVLDTGRIYAVKGNQGTGTERLLEKIMRAAVEKGYYTELYYCPLSPAKLEHIVIPDLDISLATVNDYHFLEVDIYDEVDLNSFTNAKILECYSDVLEFNREEFELLLERAAETIKMAKVVHDRMEEYYIENMDFEAVNICIESTLARILGK